MGLFSKEKPGTTPPAAGDPDFEPVAGVSLELYTEIAKGLAAYNYDQTKGPELAAMLRVALANSGGDRGDGKGQS